MNHVIVGYILCGTLLLALQVILSCNFDMGQYCVWLILGKARMFIPILCLMMMRFSYLREPQELTS